jgi:Reverse transcriptase (RNA-dependent DNA polymerase)
MIIAIATEKDWEIDWFDFNSAYLNGELDPDEEIYMEFPPSYKPQGMNTILWLQKTLYGLKQASRCWYNSLSQALTNLGFSVSQANPGVFHTKEEGKLLILAIHVDDCTFTGPSRRLLEAYKEKINAKYSITNLRPLHWLLGIKVERDCKLWVIWLSQTSYINSIIGQFSLNDAKPVTTLMEPRATYSCTECPTNPANIDRMKWIPYHEAIGSLMYASVATRPDITFSISTLSQFLDNPGSVHWEATKWVIRYLAGTKDINLMYGTEHHDLLGFMDADGAMQSHWCVISGYTFLINGGAISWSLRKQELVMLSTAEVEYVATTHAAKEGIWLWQIINKLFWHPIGKLTTLFCNNQSAIRLAMGTSVSHMGGP